MQVYVLQTLEWYAFTSAESSVTSVCISLENIWKTIEKDFNKFINNIGYMSEIVNISIKKTGVILHYVRPCMDSQTIEWRIQKCNVEDLGMDT